MRRGDLWIAAGGPDYLGNPRPMLVLQSDLFVERASVTVCPVTSTLHPLDFRVAVEPGRGSGLRASSQVMVDKMGSIARSKMRDRVGRIADAEMAEVEAALMLWLGLTRGLQTGSESRSST